MYECARALNLECMLGSATEGLEYDYEDDTDIPQAFYTPFKDIWEDTRCDTYDIIEEIKDQGTLLSSRKILWLNTVPNQEEAQIAFGGTVSPPSSLNTFRASNDIFCSTETSLVSSSGTLTQ